MKKNLITFFSTVLGWVVATSRAFAAQPIFNITGSGLVEQTNATSEILSIMQYFFTASFPLAVAGIVIGGFIYMTSAGDAPRAEKGKNIITYSIVGLVLILLAFVIISTVNSILISD